ncbi:MAG: hypothetical protein OXE47_09035 [Gammaproteobacteria bacterium]|nr:hypothetical protein [Gammaproteobacteria bacterium]
MDSDLIACACSPALWGKQSTGPVSCRRECGRGGSRAAKMTVARVKMMSWRFSGGGAVKRGTKPSVRHVEMVVAGVEMVTASVMAAVQGAEAEITVVKLEVTVLEMQVTVLEVSDVG